MTSSPSTGVRHVSHMLSEAVRVRGDAEYAVCNGRRLTFSELEAWVDQAAAQFLARGVGPRDRVVVMMPNSLEVVVAQLAAWRMGAVPIPVVAMYRQHELRHILGEAAPKLIVTDATVTSRDMEAEFDECLVNTGVQVVAKYALGAQRPGWLDFPQPTGERALSLPEVTIGPHEECLVLYTSGTTSAPKGAKLSTAAIVAATGAYDRVQLDDADTALVMGPLAHIAGMITGCLIPLRTGCRAAIMRRWEVGAAVELIDAEGVTFSTGPNLFLRELVTAYEAEERPLHRLRIFAVGAAPTPPSLVERAEALGISALRCYGMTEAAGSVTMAAPDSPIHFRANFDGQVVDGVDVRIVDDADRELAHGVEGNIQLAGKQLFLGYIDPVATRQQLRDGWFDTGDVGSVTADRWLSITGRTKDIINRGGEKLSSRDIEEAVLKHPDIDNVAVIGIPDPRLGEAVCAFVTLRRGSVWPGEEQLAEFLRSLDLARVKFPVEWHVLDEIPATATGKVKKNSLAELRGQSNDA